MGPTTTKKSKTEILKSKKNMLRSNSKQSGESVLKKKEKLRYRKDLQQRKVLSPE